MSKKQRLYWPLLLSLILLILFREEAITAAQKGIELCMTCIIPSLFPFFVLSNLLVHSDFTILLARRCGALMEKYFHLPDVSAIAPILGFLGGYPIGAKTAAQLCADGHLPPDQASQLLAVCNNTGPAIFFGLAGSMLFTGLHKPICLYLIHILSTVLTGVLLRPQLQAVSYPHTPSNQPRKVSFSEAIWQAAVSCGKISAYIILFAIIINLVLQLLPPMPPVMTALVTGFLDLPNGLAALQAVESDALRFILCSVTINWGGLCVHAQTKAVTEPAGLTLHDHLKGKLLTTFFSCLLSCIAVGIHMHRFTLCLVFIAGIIILFFIKTRVEIMLNSRYNSYKAG